MIGLHMRSYDPEIRLHTLLYFTQEMVVVYKGSHMSYTSFRFQVYNCALFFHHSILVVQKAT